jgi:hypothetical protein
VQPNGLRRENFGIRILMACYINLFGLISLIATIHPRDCENFFLTPVHAYRDDGFMSEVSRWMPRKVFCTEHADRSDIPGLPYVVKFRQGIQGTCALISEVVCNNLFRLGDIKVLDARFVLVSENFAASYRSRTEIGYRIEDGLHFGTRLKSNVEDGPPEDIDDIEDLQQLIDIWVFDSWVCNIDRTIHGNILLELGLNGKFQLIASDQSDCFGGSGCLADGQWKKIMRERGAAGTVAFLDRAIYNVGEQSLRESISKVRKANSQSELALASVPKEWWATTGIKPAELIRALDDRSKRIETIIDFERWKNLNSSIAGGFILGDQSSKPREPKR